MSIVAIDKHKNFKKHLNKMKKNSKNTQSKSDVKKANEQRGEEKEAAGTVP